MKKVVILIAFSVVIIACGEFFIMPPDGEYSGELLGSWKSEDSLAAIHSFSEFYDWSYSNAYGNEKNGKFSVEGDLLKIYINNRLEQTFTFFIADNYLVIVDMNAKFKKVEL